MKDKMLKVAVVWVDVYCERHAFSFCSLESCVSSGLSFHLDCLRENPDFLNVCGGSIEELKA